MIGIIRQDNFGDLTNMSTLTALPNNGLKPISREAIARCIEIEKGDMDLAEKLRSDSSFDVAIVSSGNLSTMEVKLFKFDGEVPLFDTYCGDAIRKAMAQLPYDKGYRYSSCIRIKRS